MKCKYLPSEENLTSPPPVAPPPFIPHEVFVKVSHHYLLVQTMQKHLLVKLHRNRFLASRVNDVTKTSFPSHYPQTFKHRWYFCFIFSVSSISSKLSAATSVIASILVQFRYLFSLLALISITVSVLTKHLFFSLPML